MLRVAARMLGLAKSDLKIAKEQAAARALKQMLIYVLFMIAYVALTMRGLSDPGPYYMTDALRGQFTTVEMLNKHVPNFAKAWTDIATVEEWYTWLEGAFQHSAFSPNTFDGGVRHDRGLAAG
mgnify:CR=1 FL=1